MSPAATATAGDGDGPLSHRRIQTVYAGLMLAMLVASLDQTIVATALPTIVGSLGGFKGLGHLAWVGTAYLVASTSAAVIYGKVSDLHGRKRVFQSALVVFLAGSALAGLARSLDQLIAFRALQGIGGGGIMALTTAVVADMVPPRRRGRYVGYVGGVLALATVAGPLLGGFLVDHLSWRWIFYVNLPVGAAAFAVIGAVLRLPPVPRAPGRRIDYLGAVLLVTAVSCGVLAASWGGVEAPWGSPRILGLGAAAALALVGFALVERRALDPLLPLGLFANPVIAITGAVGCLAGVVLFGSIVFLPLFLQVAKGASATSSGLLILPLMIGVLVASIATGRLVTRTGRYKRFPVVGCALMTVAFWLLSLLRAGTATQVIVGEMVLLGIGIGLLMPVLVLAAQNAAPRRHLGVVTSLAQFFRELGGTFGVALFGAVFASRLAADLARRLPAGAGGKPGGRALAVAPQGSPAALRRLPAPVHQAVVESVARSTATVFHWAMPFALTALLLTLALRELPLRETHDDPQEAEDARATPVSP